MPAINAYIVNRAENGLWQIVHASGLQRLAWGFIQREQALVLVEFLADAEKPLPANWYADEADEKGRRRLVFGSGPDAVISEKNLTLFAAERVADLIAISDDRRQFINSIHRFVVSTASVRNGAPTAEASAIDDDELEEEVA